MEIIGKDSLSASAAQYSDEDRKGVGVAQEDLEILEPSSLL